MVSGLDDRIMIHDYMFSNILLLVKSKYLNENYLKNTKNIFLIFFNSQFSLIFLSLFKKIPNKTNYPEN